MLDPSFLESYLSQLTPEEWATRIPRLLPQNATNAVKTAAVEALLRGPAGRLLREKMGRWILAVVPVQHLVPDKYEQWRPPVQDAMLFVVSRLSAARLAPKVVEQAELPPDTAPEERLLRLIAKVPGLQKLGQVLSRNRHLRPSVRDALAELENGIHDVSAEDMRAIVQQELGPRLNTFAVEIEPAILSEASVSAVVRFTWWNRHTQQRERGVFKILKPHIPACFAEDMQLLQELAEYFGARHREYGYAAHVLPDTFSKVRRLLQHEVEFLREQATLRQACSLYRSLPGVRVPHVIPPLCTAKVTAITEEHGVKVTSAAAGLSDRRRRRVAEQLIESIVAVPLFAKDADAIFHADPHAGNLLYNSAASELIILDWALTERLSRDLRRHLALLFFGVSLRDPMVLRREINALTQRASSPNSRQERTIRECVASFLDELPLVRIPSLVDTMKLLERLAIKGVRFPAPLIMFSKVLFTLDGILDNIGGSGVWMDLTIARHLAQRWLTDRDTFRLPINARDWIDVQCSALLYGGRLLVQWQQALVDRFLPEIPQAAVAST